MLEGSILQQLVSAHRETQYPINLGVYYKNTLVALCHALEDFILQSSTAPLVIAAFQQGKWYLQEAARYGELAKKASHIAILATQNSGFEAEGTSERSNVTLVNLNSDDPVAQEWHLIILSPSYTAMVLCQELSENDYEKLGKPEGDLSRKFYGFWTFEPELVWEAVELAIAHIGKYNPELQQKLSQQQQTMQAEFATHPKEDVGRVVSEVVKYLENSHDSLSDQIEPDEVSYLPAMQALDDNLFSNEMQAFLRMAQLIDLADVKNPKAAAEVAVLTEAIAQILDLPAWQQKRLRLASLLHRLVPALRTVPVERQTQGPSCELVSGVQALRAMPRLRAIARIITHQTEHWDGTGTPGELAYDAIPLESRILGLMSYFQARVNDIRMYSTTENSTPPSRSETLSRALADCQEKAGTVFDPKLVETLQLLVMGMQQGISLSATPPKIASGIWLLEG
ncbi:MAG: DICT sensory domain-containing protein [Chroococcales cyanobacterium]